MIVEWLYKVSDKVIALGDKVGVDCDQMKLVYRYLVD